MKLIQPLRLVSLLVAFCIAVTAVVFLLPGKATAAEGAAGASISAASVPANSFGKDAAVSQDITLGAYGDGSGYHLQIASEKDGFAWRSLAVIKPQGKDSSSWTGYQCLSGDGKYAAVAILPSSAVDISAARDRGAFA
ncbi:conserved hypothetical protein [Renibacterium salmoninarum ATCC 33209]|uniref:Secreted protein n=1 Tax=Renibacterium salmoninarum (strain ATCC 33209 / DSM 20767 / JCM 11484 / NBRC 15589 / NCIMB 2235) TaxID=288705 RepID=A9WTK6_RENSM|nr:hypothetical protein [Renibacterium salmoninarum]ABY24527.1 conserved hypothetical protein [Renibacterium salmoninarum ATCC 33209]